MKNFVIPHVMHPFTAFDASVFKPDPQVTKGQLQTTEVWVAKPGIVKSDYPGVDWNDIAAIEKDPRFGSMRKILSFGVTDEAMAQAEKDGDVSAVDIAGADAALRPVTLASLGLFALLLL